MRIGEKGKGRYGGSRVGEYRGRKEGEGGVR